jgi:hypothetical protein
MAYSTATALAESRKAGRELAHAFNQGAQPQAVSASIVLVAGEFCVGVTAGSVFEWADSDGQYVKKGGGYVFGGGGFGMAFNAARLTTNVMGNSIRKARAGREATFQWRPLDQGQLFITNRRFAIQGARQWIDLWYQNVRLADCNGRAIELEMSGSPRTALQIPAPDYWFVMFNKLAYDRIVMPPDDRNQG